MAAGSPHYILESQVAGLSEPACHVPPIRAASTRRFGLVWLLTPILWTVAWPALSLLWLNRYDHRESAFIHGLYERKAVIAERKAPRAADASRAGRIVLVGGSATLIGVDAELMEMKLGRPTLNLGTHAGVRLDYLLHRARQFLRPGDTMVFCPEYELWRYTPDLYAWFDWSYAITYDRGYLLSLDRARLVRTLYSVPLADYVRSASGWRRRLTGDHYHTRPRYDLSTLSPNGDLRADLPNTDFGPVTASDFPDVNEAPSGKIVHEFGAWAKANGVKLLFCFPNLCTPDNRPPDAAGGGLEKFKHFLGACGFTVVDRPEDAYYPRAWFSDTQYHPNAACRRVRTESLIRRLRPHLGLSIAPEPAAPRNVLLVSGDAHRPIAGNIFAHDPAARVRYWSESPVEHPDAITPAEVARSLAAGVAVHVDDAALAARLEQSGWRTKPGMRAEARLAQWVKVYPDHVFLLAGAGANVIPAALLPPGRVAGPVVAAVGTGEWAGVERAAPPARGGARLVTDLRSLTGRPVPQLSLEVKYDNALAGGRPEILVNRRNRVPDASAAAGFSVVVIDPRLGVVADAATFPADGTPAVVWQMHRLVAPPAQP